jgi:hypothetical protein
MTKRELLRVLDKVPDDAEIFTPESDMPGWCEVGSAIAAPIGFGMGGPYPIRRKLTASEQSDIEWGVFID